MSQGLTPFNVSGLGVGQSGSIDLTQVMNIGGLNPAKKPTIRIHNDSGSGMLVVLPNSGISFNLPAGGWQDTQPQPGETAIEFTVLYLLPNPPVTLFLATFFGPNEDVPPMTILGNSPVGIGGTVTTMGGVSPYFDVMNGYGAAGDGVTVDTTRMQNAINAAGVHGGSVYLPPPPVAYLIDNTLVVNADNVGFLGNGRTSTIITSASFPPNAPMIWFQSPGGAGNFRFGSFLKNIRLVNTAGPTSVIGVQLDSTYYAKIENVDIEGVFANNIYLNGISTAFGAYTTIRGCHIGNVPGGAASGGIGILSNNHEFNVIDGCVINWFKNAGGYGVKLQNGSNEINGCTFDENDTSIWIWFQAHNVVQACQFDRGVTQFIYLNGCQFTKVVNSSFQGFIGTGSKSILNVDTGSNGQNVIANNTVKGGSGWTNFVTESAGGGGVNLYEDNNLGGTGVTRLTGEFRGNRGYNPVGFNVTQPAVPASGVQINNPTGVDCMVAVIGGTVTSIAIGGNNTGLTNGWFRVPANSNITWFGSVAPTWNWFGD